MGKKPDPAYNKYKAGQAKISRERSEAGREVGPLPKVGNKRRKAKCRLSLRLFCETYFKARFWLGWSADHLKAIAKLEASILKGGLFALAMPRGSGKTTLAECAAAWAILYGHRQFVVLIGSTDDAACEMLDSIKIAIETNDELGEDFPEACYPIRKMEGINNRAGGQTLDGERTRVAWTAKEANFPTVKGSKCSGAVIRVTGITGRVRGMKAATADGKTIRPDFAIADDPQTDDSAVSLPEIEKREKKLRGAVKGLAGPGKSISMVVPCTVIASRDLSDRILDRDRNPQFQGERMKMVYAFPSNQKLWDEYGDLRKDWFDADKVGDGHNAFYRVNREAMDAGAVVAWSERFDPELEISGVQAAMNLLIDNRREFFAEYQNQPQDEDRAAGAKRFFPEAIRKRLSGLDRLAVPREAVRIVSFIDAGGELLWYGVVAFDNRFGGSLIDYGEWPRQSRRVFSSHDVKAGLSADFPGLSESERVYAGLERLVGELAGREYRREGTGEAMRVERVLIDAGWQAATIYKFCRQNAHAGIIYPSKGIGRTTTSRGVGEWKPRPGERSGYHWRLTMSETGSGRMVQFDPDAWKSFLFERANTATLASVGALTLYGREESHHEQISEHFAAEYAEPITLRGATFDKWQVLPGRMDNHLLDVLVGCCVAGSVQGLVWSPGGGESPATPRPKIKLSDVYARKQREKAGAR